MANGNEELGRLITDLIGGLDSKLDRRFDELNIRFDTQGTRLDRHAALIQTGSRWTSRMNSWSEKIDSALETKDMQIAELIRRIEKLESQKPI